MTMFRLRQDDNSRLVVERTLWGSSWRKLIWFGLLLIWAFLHVAIYWCFAFSGEESGGNPVGMAAFWLLGGMFLAAYVELADLLFVHRTVLFDPHEGSAQLRRSLFGVTFYRARHPLEFGEANFFMTKVHDNNAPRYIIWYRSPTDREVKVAVLRDLERAEDMIETLHRALGPSDDQRSD